MAKYVTTKRIIGAGIVPVGSVVELTDAQAKHPLYRNRVRKHDGEVKLEAATPSAASGKAPTKGEIAKRLKELEIKFDGRGSAEELAALLPDGDPLKPVTE